MCLKLGTQETEELKIITSHFIKSWLLCISQWKTLEYGGFFFRLTGSDSDINYTNVYRRWLQDSQWIYTGIKDISSGSLTVVVMMIQLQ